MPQWVRAMVDGFEVRMSANRDLRAGVIGFTLSRCANTDGEFQWTLQGTRTCPTPKSEMPYRFDPWGMS